MLTASPLHPPLCCDDLFNVLSLCGLDQLRKFVSFDTLENHFCILKVCEENISQRWGWVGAKCITYTQSMR